MNGQRGSVALRVVNPVIRAASQSAFRRYHGDLNGMRKFLDRAVCVGLLARPAPGCRIVDGELGGLTTREYHPARPHPGRAVLYLHGGGFLMYARGAYTGFFSRLANDLQTRVVVPQRPGRTPSTHSLQPSTIVCTPMRYYAALGRSRAS